MSLLRYIIEEIILSLKTEEFILLSNKSFFALNKQFEMILFSKSSISKKFSIEDISFLFPSKSFKQIHLELLKV